MPAHVFDPTGGQIVQVGGPDLGPQADEWREQADPFARRHSSTRGKRPAWGDAAFLCQHPERQQSPCKFGLDRIPAPFRCVSR